MWQAGGLFWRKGTRGRGYIAAGPGQERWRSFQKVSGRFVGGKQLHDFRFEQGITGAGFAHEARPQPARFHARSGEDTLDCRPSR
jgi:hypothetical protein